MRNTFLFAIAAGIGEVFIFTGKVFIAILTMLSCFYINDYYTKYELNSIFGPLICIGVLAYTIGMMFMMVWGMGMDAIL